MVNILNLDVGGIYSLENTEMVVVSKTETEFGQTIIVSNSVSE